MSPKWHFVFEKLRAVCGAGVDLLNNYKKNVILMASLRSPIESIDAEQPKVMASAQWNCNPSGNWFENVCEEILNERCIIGEKFYLLLSSKNVK